MTSRRDRPGQRGRGLWPVALGAAILLALAWLVVRWSTSASSESTPVPTPPVAEAAAPQPELPDVPADRAETLAPAVEPPMAEAPTPAVEIREEDLGVPVDDGPLQLRVIVVDTQSAPVPDARVRVWLDEAACEADQPVVQELVTDSRGRTTVAMQSWQSVLVAEREDLGTSGLWRRNDVKWGSNLDGETAIPLSPQGRVRGIVVEADDRPVAGARVHSWFVSGGSRGKPRTPADVLTDARGRFDLEIDRGHRLALQAQDRERRSAEERFDVEPGGEHEIVLRFPGDWWIAGSVQDALGRPVAGGLVKLWQEFPGYDIAAHQYPKQNCYTAEVTSAPDGSFRFDVPRLAGYTLLASHEGPPASDTLSVQLDASRPRESVTLVLPEPGAIAGRLVTEAGLPLAGVEIQAMPDGDPFSTSQSCYLPTPRDRFGDGQAITDSSGAFRIEPLHPRGVYRLTSKPDPAHPDRRLTRAGVPAGTLDLEWVASDSELVRGFVTGIVVSAETGEPLTEYEVELVERVSATRFRIGSRPARREAGGRFRIEGLTLGSTYGLDVRAGGCSAAEVPWWTASEQGHDVVVRLERPGALEVEVVDEYGGLASLARVMLDLQGQAPGRMSWAPQTTDDTGRALFGSLNVGSYRVTATRGERRAEADVVVVGGGTVRARLELRSP